jgi:hypothetical protein
MSGAEKIQRVRLMADHEQTAWDLNDNDMNALRHVLDVNAKMLEALKESKLQIEYLHERFWETGSGNMVLAKIQSAIKLATGE